MVETSFEATRRLLEEAVDICEDPECVFRIRTALQLLAAMETELESLKGDLEFFEQALEANPELETALSDLELIDD